MTRRTASKPAPARRGPTPRGISPSGGTPSVEKATEAGDAALHFDPTGYVRSRVRGVPDFPKPGILFRDITPLLAEPRAFHMVVDHLVEQFVGQAIDAVVAIDARGFIFGAPLASRLNTRFVPARKPGKLPAQTVRVEYGLEYGEAALELHEDALGSDANVVVVDDLLATGGTAAAAGELVATLGANVVAYAFVIELEALGGRAKLDSTRVVSLMKF